MGIVDFNCHILPGMDEIDENDLKTVEGIFKAAEKQNITAMVVSPFIDPETEAIDDFIKRRILAVEKIEELAEKYHITLVMGALVKLSKNLSVMPGNSLLRIRNTNLILIDMPDTAWTQNDIEALENLRRDGFRPVIADFDLCLEEQEDSAMVVELLKKQFFIQVSTDALLHFGTKKNAMELFVTGNAQILGSSCTNVREVKELSEARKVLLKNVGEEGLQELDRFANEILKLTEE